MCKKPKLWLNSFLHAKLLKCSKKSNSIQFTSCSCFSGEKIGAHFSFVWLTFLLSLIFGVQHSKLNWLNVLRKLLDEYAYLHYSFSLKFHWAAIHYFEFKLAKIYPTREGLEKVWLAAGETRKRLYRKQMRHVGTQVYKELMRWWVREDDWTKRRTINVLKGASVSAPLVLDASILKRTVLRVIRHSPFLQLSP